MRPQIGDRVRTNDHIRQIIPTIWKEGIVIGYDGRRNNLVFVMYDKKNSLIACISYTWLETEFNPSKR